MAKNREALDQLGVSHVCSVLGPDQDFEHVAVADENRFWCQVTDRVESEAEMREKLPTAIAKLNEWMGDSTHTGTLVHC